MQVYDLVLKAAKDSPYRDHINENHLALMIRDYALSGSLFVEYAGDEPVAFLAANKALSHPIMGPGPYAIEVALYVRPEHRHKGYGHKLVKRFEAWAKENGCKHAFFGKKLRGYQPLETMYWKML